MPGRLKKLIMLLSSLLLFVPGEASARLALTGLADLEYTEFQEKNQNTEIEASQFKQKYDVGYSTGGVIIDRGIGSYALSLNYQYLAADTTFDSGDLGSGDLSAAGHTFWWDGSLNIAPRKVPFRLSLYSGNTNPLETSTTTGIPGVQSSGLAPDAIDSVESSGISRLSGLNLHFEFGGKKRRGNGGNGNGNGGNGNGGNGNGGNGNGGNGNGGNGNGGNGNGGNGNGGNGNGNGLVRLSLPKGFVDYAKTVTEKTDVYESTDDLRFSLNDKKNWLHYKWKRADNLLGGGDSSQQQFQIGNVDRNGGRGWFYLTNWLILSTDASYTRYDAEDTTGTNNTYSVNMFTSAFRLRWDASFYGAYTQTLNNEEHTGASQISLPLYIATTLGTDTSLTWKNSFSQGRTWNMDNPYTLDDEETITKDTKEVVEDISYTHYHLTGQDLSFKSRYSIVKAMVLDDGNSTSQALRFYLDSSPGKSYSYSMGYTVNVIKDDDPSDITDDSISQTISIGGRYAVSQRIGVTASQTASFSEDRDSAYPDSRSYSTSIGANLYIHRTLGMDLSGSRSYTENIGASHGESIGFNGNIRFTPASWLKATSSNGYTQEKGESSTETTDRSSYTSDNHMAVKINRSFSSRTNITYSVADERSTITTGKSTTLKAEEGFEYIRFIQRFRATTLYSINGSVNYTESKATDSAKGSSEGASLGFNHYPYRRLSWGASGSYNVSNSTATSQSGSVYVAMPFPKLNISASYSFSKTEDEEDGFVDAQRFFVKVSKRF